MIELPYVVEPPDLIMIEVLEALPGRPISGERLVRNDGMISLSFYGEIYVRGLTSTQIKEKVVLHLRKFLPDEVLGLVRKTRMATGRTSTRRTRTGCSSTSPATIARFISSRGTSLLPASSPGRPTRPCSTP